MGQLAVVRAKTSAAQADLPLQGGSAGQQPGPDLVRIEKSLQSLGFFTPTQKKDIRTHIQGCLSHRANPSPGGSSSSVTVT